MIRREYQNLTPTKSLYHVLYYTIPYYTPSKFWSHSWQSLSGLLVWVHGHSRVEKLGIQNGSVSAWVDGIGLVLTLLETPEKGSMQAIKAGYADPKGPCSYVVYTFAL